MILAEDLVHLIREAGQRELPPPQKEASVAVLDDLMMGLDLDPEDMRQAAVRVNQRRAMAELRDLLPPLCGYCGDDGLACRFCGRSA